MNRGARLKETHHVYRPAVARDHHLALARDHCIELREFLADFPDAEIRGKRAQAAASVAAYSRVSASLPRSRCGPRSSNA